MAKTILFVGEEQPLWQEFRNHAAETGGAWSAEFARTAPEALDCIERSTFAAVVSDVHLQDRSGLDLLDEVLRRQPTSYRVVMSALSDTSSTIQCIGRGHHYLSMPCDVNALLSALDRESALRSWLPGREVQNLIAQMKKVPSPPSIYFQIAAEIASENASVERVGEIIAQDPAITAKVLQLANSAVFGLQLEIIHPGEAVAYIGLETTKALVLFAHTFSSFDRVQMSGFSVESLWGHSVLAGRFARQIAETENSTTEISDQAFTSGLLHDIGKLLFAANLPAELGEVRAKARADRISLCEAERQVLGASHAEVGGGLLCIWGLPKPIVEAVALHHQPSRLEVQDLTPLGAAHAANIIAHKASPEPSYIAPSELDVIYLQKLGLDDHVERWRHDCLALQEPA